VGGSDRTGAAARLALVRLDGTVQDVALGAGLVSVDAVAGDGTTVWAAVTRTGGGGEVLVSRNSGATFTTEVARTAGPVVAVAAAGGHAVALVVRAGGGTDLLLLPEGRRVTRPGRRLLTASYDAKGRLRTAGFRGTRLVVETFTAGGSLLSSVSPALAISGVTAATPLGDTTVFVGGTNEPPDGPAALVAAVVDSVTGAVRAVPLEGTSLGSATRLANGHLLVAVGAAGGGVAAVELDGTTVVATQPLDGTDRLLVGDPRVAVAWVVGAQARLLG
jgi:hypothetical protein